VIAGDRVERRARGAGKKAHFFGGFRGTLRSRAHAGNGGTVGGVGKVIRTPMDESGCVRRFWPVKSLKAQGDRVKKSVTMG
jgi:hypothetical protein